MAHRSENHRRLSINWISAEDIDDVFENTSGYNQVFLLVLPQTQERQRNEALDGLDTIIRQVSNRLGANATLITLGESVDLVEVHAHATSLHYQLWISVKRKSVLYAKEHNALPEQQFGALVHTKYEGAFQHVVTRVEYTYCPACEKTTKDYGGKKHTYNSYGTLLSDIWRDIEVDLEGDVSAVLERFADLLAIEDYQELRVVDCRSLWSEKKVFTETSLDTHFRQPALLKGSSTFDDDRSKLLVGDSLELLKEIPSSTIDFAFADPPYNLGKKYSSYDDDLSIQEYFVWCDEWITEVARVLRPGGTFALLNIPLWSIRHFLHLRTVLDYQNWIAWDALSFPVRKIMPAHYSIICFSKGQPRPLPGLTSEAGSFPLNNTKNFWPLEPLVERFCSRASCIRKRNAYGKSDRGKLTDLWWDIHRLKHNARRVDHPCQLPPQLMYRLISIFTKPNELVLDCFNGAGTTTLAAHQLGRQYLGIELSEKYHQIALKRHQEIREGIDPFRKVKRQLTEKNSTVARVTKKRYEVPKKTLQLEVRRIAGILGRLPKREDVIAYAKYPIKYYDSYFSSWGEVCAAARNDGMTEIREESTTDIEVEEKVIQLRLFESIGGVEEKKVIQPDTHINHDSHS